MVDSCREAFEKFILSKGRDFYRTDMMPNGEEYEETMTEQAWEDWRITWNASHDRCADLFKDTVFKLNDKELTGTSEWIVETIQNDKVNG